MSKSLGNSPDPLELIERYGADAIRFTMIYNTSAGQDVHFSEKLIEMGGNFANKVWNVTNFVLMNLEGFDPSKVEKSDLQFELVDCWIYSRLHTAIAETETYLQKYTLDEAAKTVYEFIKGDFCDWYVEMAKVRLYMNDDLQSKLAAQWVLWEVLETALRLLHPFMPFITEELWQQLKISGESIMLQAFPKSDKNQINPEVESAMERLQEAITAFRNIRAEANISPGKEVPALIKTADPQEMNILEENQAFLMKLAKLESLKFGPEIEKPELSGMRVVGKSELVVPLLGLLDLEAEKEKILNQIAKLEQGLASTERKLSDEKFLAKAPTQVIEREKNNQADYQHKIEKLQQNLALLFRK